jgi:hypothetical protein
MKTNTTNHQRRKCQALTGTFLMLSFALTDTARAQTPLEVAQQAYIKASNTETQTNRQRAIVEGGDWFGNSVALSGNTLVVGAA